MTDIENKETGIVSLNVTLYERTASVLIAMLCIIGFLVAAAAAIFFSLQVSPLRAVPVQIVHIGEDGGNDTGLSDPNVLIPGIQIEIDRNSFSETVESLVQTVSENAAVLAETVPNEDALPLVGSKTGDGRIKGSGTGLSGRVRQWEFQFGKGITVEEYAAMLDFFQIELGILLPTGKVVYVSKLSESKPAVREGESADEKRYYLTWLKGSTEDADRELLAKAGVSDSSRLFIKFIPPELEYELKNQEDLRRFAPLFRSGMNQNNICVFGNVKTLEENKELFKKTVRPIE
ncbi:hypothetical protein FACS189427_13350 [Planctomycetales bacterium]|nr:hypothetical protein FACS189427_13350 [Planctomycetales bacterium]